MLALLSSLLHHYEASVLAGKNVATGGSVISSFFVSTRKLRISDSFLQHYEALVLALKNVAPADLGRSPFVVPLAFLFTNVFP